LIRAAFMDPGAMNLSRKGFSSETRKRASWEEHLARKARHESVLAQVIREGIKSGEFKKVHVESTAAFLFDLLRGLMARVVLGMSHKDSDNLAQDLEKIFLHGVTK